MDFRGKSEFLSRRSQAGLERRSGGRRGIEQIDASWLHDFPAGENWNIDHIVIAPSGVFALETKARRKKRGLERPEAHELVFDGACIHFPGGWDQAALQQAQRNANWLSDHLSKAEAEPIKVQPLLVFPGWYVHRKGKGPVHVVNPRELRAAILRKGPAVLPPERMRRIAERIEDKCRDVPF